MNDQVPADLLEIADALPASAGGDVRWGEDGKLTGVLDWDRAHLFAGPTPPPPGT
ncbi:hypothetical protein [Nonomuraea typhae]|uniref:hypothetical protein n=1 Tax=Nonomuraea typhae TaxID=2603600 RepID=UPI0012FA5B5C|nr:hypothetical protein [Nonomuraea typhae]